MDLNEVVVDDESELDLDLNGSNQVAIPPLEPIQTESKEFTNHVNFSWIQS
jgi:hypothetical protein